MEFIKKHPVISLIIVSLVAGGVLSLVTNLKRLIEGKITIATCQECISPRDPHR